MSATSREDSVGLGDQGDEADFLDAAARHSHKEPLSIAPEKPYNPSYDDFVRLLASCASSGNFDALEFTPGELRDVFTPTERAAIFGLIATEITIKPKSTLVKKQLEQRVRSLLQ